MVFARPTTCTKKNATIRNAMLHLLGTPGIILLCWRHCKFGINFRKTFFSIKYYDQFLTILYIYTYNGKGICSRRSKRAQTRPTSAPIGAPSQKGDEKTQGKSRAYGDIFHNSKQHKELTLHFKL